MRIFGNIDIENCNQTYIKECIRGNSILINRTSKQVYDKLHHLHKSKKFGNVICEEDRQEIRQKVAFKSKDTSLIKKIFVNELKEQCSVIQQQVSDVVNSHPEGVILLQHYSVEQLVAKIRYEKLKLRKTKIYCGGV